jgi:transcription elongation factor
MTDLQFHSSDFISSTLRPRKVAGGERLGGRDPNEVYIGKRVKLVGASFYKGYKGLIKNTTPNGMARVELDARLQGSVEVQISHLAIAL